MLNAAINTNTTLCLETLQHELHSLQTFHNINTCLVKNDILSTSDDLQALGDHGKTRKKRKVYLNNLYNNILT